MLQKVYPQNQYENITTQQGLAINHNGERFAEIRKKIQNYSFLPYDKIGKGYSSTVYKGKNDLKNLDVAIKVIQLKSLRDQNSKIMLHNQIQCLKTMNHNNILKFYDCFYTINNCYIITELCCKSDLSKLLKFKKRISEQQAKDIFYQIFLGYRHFNHQNYVHRDIKPANILISKKDQYKIGDFGFCKRRSNIERETYNVGTPIYMPFQSISLNIYNEKTDVWSLGATLYQMVFGQVPFKARLEQELKIEIQKCNIKFPEDVNVSFQIKDFIRNCLKKDPLSRFGVKEMENHVWLKTVIKEKQKTTYTKPFIPKQLKDISNTMRFHQNDQTISGERICNPFQQNLKAKTYSVGYRGKSVNKIENISKKLKVSDLNNTSLLQQKEKNQKRSRKLSMIEVTSKSRSINIKQKKKQTDFDQNDISENKENFTIENNSISIKPSKYLKIKQKITVSTKQRKAERQIKSKENKQRLEKVVSLINFFRLLNQMQKQFTKLIECLTDEDLNQQTKMFCEEISSFFYYHFRKHLEIMKNKENLFELESETWNKFINSKDWTLYQNVLTKYEKKYSSFMNLQKKQSLIERKITDFNFRIKTFCFASKEYLLVFMQLKAKFQLLVALKYSLHLLALTESISSEGWEGYSEKYRATSSVVLQNVAVTYENYQQNRDQIQSKLLTL